MSDPSVTLTRSALVLLAIVASGCTASGAADSAESEAETSAASSASSAASDTAMIDYLERTMGIARDKFVQIGGAFSDEEYDWRPMDGVRSVREVLVHVSADNWYGPALMGIEAPEDTGITDQGGTVGAYQDARGNWDQARTVAELERSFEHMMAALDATRDRLDATTQLGANTVTYGDVWVRLITHMHEHLGQTIAYARSNEVVPPWSR